MDPLLPLPLDPAAEDPWQWLEALDAPESLDWVRQRNAACRQALAQDEAFATRRAALQAVLDDQARIPAVARCGDWVYNFWRDAAHPRGLWRRAPVGEHLQAADPDWQLLLDLDALAAQEGEPWVWHGALRCGPGSERALVELSRGGADAAVLREFDMASRQFLPQGFQLPEAKSRVVWLDEDRVLVATDTGPGSLTDSGYPRQIRCWTRGTPLDQAPCWLAADPQDVAAHAWVDHGAQPPRVVLGSAPAFFTTREHLWHDGQARPVDKPESAGLGFWHGWLLLHLREDWSVAGRQWSAGSLLAAPVEDYLAGRRDGLQALFQPSPTCALQTWAGTAQRLVLTLSDQVTHRAEMLWPADPGPADAAPLPWQRLALPLPEGGTLALQPLYDPQLAHDPWAETLLVTATGFLTPERLLALDLDAVAAGQGDAALRPLRARPAHFDADGLSVHQAHARSADGTAVPYFVIGPAWDPAGDDRPCLLYGYGGFEVSLEPWYLGGTGRAWLSQGGRLVVANIRGGGEFGPAWHQAALRGQRQRAYDDFIAVAEDLRRRGLAAPGRLGIQGGSNGGLLVGAVMVQRPDLFDAVVCQVPLLDMKRYHRLLAGASWMSEYGDPDDPADWAYLSRLSPYHNLRPGVRYPPLLLVTSTRDDRVHPAHARKMAARMLSLGQPVLYHELMEGGHGGGADNAQIADRQALEYGFLLRVLGPR
ncbi:prolyl oligopeptidase family serine peptidase [Ideonella livida]|uniref:S9 family peptidase n=1 Tax=Ideonella livida TaxID=2707176 RepID=A0A7C9PF44_9BURK|nr:prolyl oligopeptidase family serine peptidase [Ideonella livida]NDY89574.1 S9 family peptidase [Ideonella livida]